MQKSLTKVSNSENLNSVIQLRLFPAGFFTSCSTGNHHSRSEQNNCLFICNIVVYLNAFYLGFYSTKCYMLHLILYSCTPMTSLPLFRINVPNLFIFVHLFFLNYFVQINYIDSSFIILLRHFSIFLIF